MKLTSRLRKIEQHLDLERDREGNHPFAPQRWMRRFITADPRYAELYAEILERAERLSRGTLPSPGSPMTLTVCMFGLFHQAPELHPSQFKPTPEPTPSSKRAIELLELLSEYTLEYQRATRDKYPEKNSGFRITTEGRSPRGG